MKSGKPALFLDRDGTIIEDRGFLSDPDDAVFFPDTITALQKVREKYLLFVVSNQSGIATGVITEDDVLTVNNAVAEKLASEEIYIRKWYFCPHVPEDRCSCRKPNPSFLLQAAEEFGIDLKRSFMIGDHPGDASAGENAGARGLYLLTGHGEHHVKELPENTPVFNNLTEAMDWILLHSEPPEEDSRI